MDQASKRAGRARTALAVVGAAALLVTGLDAVTYAATGQSVILGKTNTANKPTTIKNTGNGPALKLKTKKSKPPLAVNSKKLVKKLNAELLDGKSLGEIAPATQTFSIGATGASGTGVAQFFQTMTLPSGQYRISLNAVVDASPGDTNVCAVLDVTKLLAGDMSGYLLYDIAADTTDGLGGTAVATVVQGNRLVFGCNFDTTTTIYQPGQFSIEKLDRVEAIPGVGATTVPRGSSRLPLG